MSDMELDDAGFGASELSLEDEALESVDEENSELDELEDESVPDESLMEFDQFYENLALDLETGQDATLVQHLLERFKQDKEDQSEADKLYQEGIKRTGLGKEAPGGAGFEGASRAVHPILAEIAIDSSSRLLRELLPPTGPIKVDIDGKVTPERTRQCLRKEKYLNRQFQDPEIGFEPAMESLSTQAPLNGDQYLKGFYDELLEKPRFEFVPSDQMIVQSTAPSFDAATRKTHILKHNVIDYDELVKKGVYRDLELTDSDTRGSYNVEKTAAEQSSEKVIGVQPDETDSQRDIKVSYEMHVRLRLDQFGLGDLDPLSAGKPAPYIVTIDPDNQQIVGLTRNWLMGKKTRKTRRHFVQFKYLPWRGPKGIGMIHLIGSLSGAMTGAVRALLDAAHIQNSPTALKLRFAQASSQNQQIEIGQVNEFEADGSMDDIRKIFMPLPFQGPSPTLLDMLGKLDGLARGVVRTTLDDMTGEEQSKNMPVGTAQARIEQGLMVFSSIFGRFHRGVKQCGELLSELNYLHMQDEELTDEDEADSLAVRGDFADNEDVLPVSDPNMFTNMQRLAQNQAILNLAMSMPDLYDIKAIHTRILELMKVPNLKEIMPEREDQKDENPVTENVKLSLGQPAFALPDQDHLAHLKVHLDYASSPMFGQSELFAMSLLPAMLDHAKHHFSLAYAQIILEAVNAELPMSIEEIQEDHPMVMEGVSQILALKSDDAIAIATQKLAPYQQQLIELQQLVSKLMPPPMMDPVQAQLKIADQESKDNQMKTQADVQNKQVDSQVKLQTVAITQQTKEKELSLKAQEMQLKAKEHQDKQAVAAEELALKQQSSVADHLATEEQLDLEEASIAQRDQANQRDAQVELTKNMQDNQTAIYITEERLKSDKSGGNMKNGNAINPGTDV